VALWLCGSVALWLCGSVALGQSTLREPNSGVYCKQVLFTPQEPPGTVRCWGLAREYCFCVRVPPLSLQALQSSASGKLNNSGRGASRIEVCGTRLPLPERVRPCLSLPLPVPLWQC